MVLTAATLQRISAPAAIQQVGTSPTVKQVVAAIGDDLISPIVADQNVSIPGTAGEATVIHKIIEPAGNITQRLVGVAIFVNKIFAFDLKTNME